LVRASVKNRRQPTERPLAGSVMSMNWVVSSTKVLKSKLPEKRKMTVGYVPQPESL
jgi:hypothetical protein